jgi:hypothetical protein
MMKKMANLRHTMTEADYTDFFNGLNPFERVLEAERLFRGLQPIDIAQLYESQELLGGELAVQEKFAMTESFLQNIKSRHPKDSVAYNLSLKLLGAAVHDACRFWISVPGQLLFDFDNFQHLEMAEIILKAMNRINRAYLHQVQTRRLEDLRVIMRRATDQQDFRHEMETRTKVIEFLNFVHYEEQLQQPVAHSSSIVASQ